MRTALRKHVVDVVALAALIVIAAGVGGYILVNERLRFPLIHDQPVRVELELGDAQAVIPGQGQTVRVAGVRIGDVGDVRLEEGRAIVTLELEPRHADLARAGATALLRPKTGLKDMFVELDPGEGAPLAEGARIPLAASAPDIDPDEVLSALDSDTRDYLRLLVSGAGKGLDGRGGDLREVLSRFEPLHRDSARVASAVARRRDNLTRLVRNYGLLLEELGRRDTDLTRFVSASERSLSALASERDNLSRLAARLPGALEETRAAFERAEELGRRIGPALTSLRPAFRELDRANRAVTPFAREAAPILSDDVRPFARAALPFTERFGAAAGDLSAAGPDISRSFHGLNRLFNMGAHNPGGAEPVSEECQSAGVCTAAERDREEGYLFWLGWVASNTVALFGTSDGQGVYRRITLGGANCSMITAELPHDTSPVVRTQVEALEAILGAVGACVG